MKAFPKAWKISQGLRKAGVNYYAKKTKTKASEIPFRTNKRQNRNIKSLKYPIIIILSIMWYVWSFKVIATLNHMYIWFIIDC